MILPKFLTFVWFLKVSRNYQKIVDCIICTCWPVSESIYIFSSHWGHLPLCPKTIRIPILFCQHLVVLLIHKKIILSFTLHFDCLNKMCRLVLLLFSCFHSCVPDAVFGRNWERSDGQDLSRKIAIACRSYNKMDSQVNALGYENDRKVTVVVQILRRKSIYYL